MMLKAIANTNTTLKSYIKWFLERLLGITMALVALIMQSRQRRRYGWILRRRCNFLAIKGSRNTPD
jgi:ATP/ADP translocase